MDSKASYNVGATADGRLDSVAGANDAARPRRAPRGCGSSSIGGGRARPATRHAHRASTPTSAPRTPATKITTLHTLGPAGTNCEMAAQSWFAQRGREGGVVVHETFEAAADAAAASPGVGLLACAAYPELHTLVYSRLDRLKMVDSFVTPTHGMVLATRPGTRIVSAVASHPAPAELAPQGLAVRHVSSNTQAAIDCAAGKVDACITTRPAMERHHLELVHDFGAVPMTFTVHASQA